MLFTKLRNRPVKNAESEKIKEEYRKLEEQRRVLFEQSLKKLEIGLT